MEIFPTSPYERYGILLGAVIGLVLFFNETTILRYLSLVSLTIGLFSFIGNQTDTFIRCLKNKKLTKLILNSFASLIFISLCAYFMAWLSFAGHYRPAISYGRNIFTQECRSFDGGDIPWYYKDDPVCDCLLQKMDLESRKRFYRVENCDELRVRKE